MFSGLGVTVVYFHYEYNWYKLFLAFNFKLIFPHIPNDILGKHYSTVAEKLPH